MYTEAMETIHWVGLVLAAAVAILYFAISREIKKSKKGQ